MSDVFEEVEENLRGEQWKTLARRWWPIAAAVLGVALIVALGFWFFDARKGWTGAEASQAYARGIQALQSENESAAEAAFVEVEAAGNAPYRALALMQRAGLRLNRGEEQEAVALLDQAAEAFDEPLVADIAHLKAAWILMDTAPLPELTERLSPLTEDGRPYRFHAREALALANLQHGQTDAARQLLQALTLELELPDTLRQRAQAAQQLIDSGTSGSIAGIVEAAARAAESAEAEAARPGAGQPGAGQPGQPGAPQAPATQTPAPSAGQ